MTTEVLTLRVPSEVKTSLESLGKIINRSKSYIAEKAISEYLDKNSWQIKELQLAEKEIQKGEFVAHEKVESYLDSWEE
jgi:RHH-type rel operon transcriptional repressor/antitoxin RelB